MRKNAFEASYEIILVFILDSVVLLSIQRSLGQYSLSETFYDLSELFFRDNLGQ